MSGVDFAYQILDGDGALALDLDGAGFEVLDTLRPGGRHWRHNVTTSPFVDGDHPTQSVLDAEDYGLTVKITGTTWAQVLTRKGRLETAVSVPLWYLVKSIEGTTTTWRCKQPADVEWPLATQNIARHSWTGTVLARVQPSPAVAGV